MTALCSRLSYYYYFYNYYYYYYHLLFEILRSVHLSVGGSRMLFCNANEALDNFRLSVKAAEVYFSISSKNYLFYFVRGIYLHSSRKCK